MAKNATSEDLDERGRPPPRGTTIRTMQQQTQQQQQSLVQPQLPAVNQTRRDPNATWLSGSGTSKNKTTTKPQIRTSSSNETRMKQAKRPSTADKKKNNPTLSGNATTITKTKPKQVTRKRTSTFSNSNRTATHHTTNGTLQNSTSLRPLPGTMENETAVVSATRRNETGVLLRTTTTNQTPQERRRVTGKTAGRSTSRDDKPKNRTAPASVRMPVVLEPSARDDDKVINQNNDTSKDLTETQPSRNDTNITTSTSNEVKGPPVLDPDGLSSFQPLRPPFASPDFKFYILDIPELTSDLIRNFTGQAKVFYTNLGINEYRAEIWVHRGLLQLTEAQGRTRNPAEAHVHFIPAYLHFNRLGLSKKYVPYQIPNPKISHIIRSAILDHSKPHVLLTPVVNPVESQKVGVMKVVRKLLGEEKLKLYSIGFERNQFWQGPIHPRRVVPIPYVVEPPDPRAEDDKNSTNSVSLSKKKATSESAVERWLSQKRPGQTTEEHTNPRIPNFVFYAGDVRKHATAWAGCNRSIVEPLASRENMFVRIMRKHEKRLPQAEYNHHMATADYCLILCGDTVTSRSLASSIIAGCLPIRVGSRYRGYCEPPCHSGWGWTITQGIPHIPYPTLWPWHDFPEVDEARFAENPFAELQTHVFEKYSASSKDQLRRITHELSLGFVYGWGNPVDSKDFGYAPYYVWKSIQDVVFLPDNVTHEESLFNGDGNTG